VVTRFQESGMGVSQTMWIISGRVIQDWCSRGQLSLPNADLGRDCAVVHQGSPKIGRSANLRTGIGIYVGYRMR